MDQNITGSAGIESAEAFGDPALSHVIQQLIVGHVGIASGEAFSQTSGVFIDPFSVPAAVWIAF
jgi:hypothetical protein